MSKAVLVVVLGFLVALLPFDGLPDTVTTTLTVLLGFVIAGLGVLMRFERLWLIRSMRGGHKTDAYAESGMKDKGGEPRD